MEVWPVDPGLRPPWCLTRLIVVLGDCIAAGRQLLCSLAPTASGGLAGGLRARASGIAREPDVIGGGQLRQRMGLAETRRWLLCSESCRLRPSG